MPWDEYPQVEAITYFSKGLGAARSGDIETAKKHLEKLNDLHKKTMLTNPNDWGPKVNAQRQTIDAWILYGTGNKKAALIKLRQAADMEDSVEKSPVTPGAVLPARELLAEMLMMTGDTIGAISEYEQCLLMNPNRRISLNGLALANKSKQRQAL